MFGCGVLDPDEMPCFPGYVCVCVGVSFVVSCLWCHVCSVMVVPYMVWGGLWRDCESCAQTHIDGSCEVAPRRGVCCNATGEEM